MQLVKSICLSDFAGKPGTASQVLRNSWTQRLPCRCSRWEVRSAQTSEEQREREDWEWFAFAALLCFYSVWNQDVVLSEGLQETLGCSFCLICLLEPLIDWLHPVSESIAPCSTPPPLPVHSFLWFVGSAIASSSPSEGLAELRVTETFWASALIMQSQPRLSSPEGTLSSLSITLSFFSSG